MAQSRLEKIGTIFTRVGGLLRTGAMKPEDKPIWYDIYMAFPPCFEPRFNRPPSDEKIKNIYYAEDVARAYHKIEKLDTINMEDFKNETQSQQFVKIYKGLKSQDPLSEEKVFETALEILADQKQRTRSKDTTNLENKGSILHNFTEATKKETNSTSERTVNIEKLFEA